MKNLPTIDELLSFLKDNLKIILLTTVSGLILFAVGIGYTVYTDSKIEGTIEEQETLIPEIDDSIALEEQFTPEETELLVEKLQETGVAFSFYLEKESADPFKSPDLLKELLISPTVLQNLEQGTNTKIEPSPELAVDVTLDPENLLLTVTIGTGNVANNKIIADAYFKVISEEQSPFFDNKSVYIAAEPESINIITDEKEITDAKLNTATNFGGLSIKKIIFLTVIVIVAGAIVGIMISLIVSLLKKEVNEIYGFAYKDEDKFLNISNVQNNSDDEVSTQIVHSIIHPAKKVKLVLSEEDLDEAMIAKLKKEANTQSGKELRLSNEPMILIANSIIDIDPKIVIDEIVFICKKNKTSKKWYEKQRKLLEIYDAVIKVILV
ncbi:hypothetical protein [Carnobacterium alterfunditum]|uniref:hypothetical protein n=1 Tax=Carnobacterium alterfunditum TaxID=28230 RepID=UPI0035948242